ncbi:Arm DNA-binding domain-containing protein [Novosphingobium sp.]|uniref:Arm DNA-binding domain-containing protein n=1 Tax=Novosphingobium sp. TaxID=1874826 RepID=UPI002603CEDA|nr:Arm DNA-binding domain-containing protein [Novosphingobium sp.]
MLSDTKIKKAAKAERDYKLADQKGLFVLVRTTGGKLWQMRYRFGGKQKLLSFGPYPNVSLAAARDARDAARRLLREGKPRSMRLCAGVPGSGSCSRKSHDAILRPGPGSHVSVHVRARDVSAAFTSKCAALVI